MECDSKLVGDLSRGKVESNRFPVAKATPGPSARKGIPATVDLARDGMPLGLPVRLNREVALSSGPVGPSLAGLKERTSCQRQVEIGFPLAR